MSKIIKILHLGDIHGDLRPFYRACSYDFDIMIHTGDFFPNLSGSQYIKSKFKIENENNFQREFFYYNRNNILDVLKDRPFIQVIGNHDYTNFNECGYKNSFVLNKNNIELENINFYGFPEINEFTDYCWNNETSEKELNIIINKIPDNVDILITHSPPYGVLDGGHIGIRGLKEVVIKRNIRLHLFGHVHENGGKYLKIDNTYFSNMYKNEFRIFRIKNHD